MQRISFNRFLLFCQCTLVLLSPAVTNAAGLDSRYEAAFEEVWQTVADSFWDESYGGVDWPVMKERYRKQIVEAESEADWAHCVEAMLAELGQSHFHLLSSNLLEQEDNSFSGLTGAFVVYLDGHLFVRRVLEGSSAEREGMKPGDEILTIGGEAIDEILKPLDAAPVEPGFLHYYQKVVLQSRLDSGATHEVEVQGAHVDGEAFELALERGSDPREYSQAMGNSPSMPYELEHHWMDEDILYIRLSTFVLEVNQKVRDLLAEAQVRGAKGVIFDLRDNPGGFAYMANSFAGMMVEEQQELGQMTLRNGFLKFIAYPQKGRFEGKVCILIDRYSASTSEIFAAGLQECGRATVVGERSMGASLPSFFKKLASGHVLQYAIADYKTPEGYRIEGSGVVPNVKVSLDREGLSGSPDPAVEAAVHVILSSNQK